MEFYQELQTNSYLTASKRNNNWPYVPRNGLLLLPQAANQCMPTVSRVNYSWFDSNVSCDSVHRKWRCTVTFDPTSGSVPSSGSLRCKRRCWCSRTRENVDVKLHGSFESVFYLQKLLHWTMDRPCKPFTSPFLRPHSDQMAAATSGSTKSLKGIVAGSFVDFSRLVDLARMRISIRNTVCWYRCSVRKALACQIIMQ